jgi:hypothetical protein
VKTVRGQCENSVEHVYTVLKEYTVPEVERLKEQYFVFSLGALPEGTSRMGMGWLELREWYRARQRKARGRHEEGKRKASGRQNRRQSNNPLQVTPKIENPMKAQV